jgi:hypothetical protein
MRVALARALFIQPEFLLLDERKLLSFDFPFVSPIAVVENLQCLDSHLIMTSLQQQTILTWTQLSGWRNIFRIGTRYDDVAAIACGQCQLSNLRRLLFGRFFSLCVTRRIL